MHLSEANPRLAGPWRPGPLRGLPAEHRRWLVRYALVGTALTNLVIGATLAWVSSLGRSRVVAWAVPLVGGPSVIPNTLATLIVLPLTTSMICTGFVRLYQRDGLRCLELAELPRAVPRLVVGPLRRGVRLATTSVGSLGPVTVLIVALVAPEGMSRGAFVVSQSAVGVLLGAAVTPLVAVTAMAEPRPAEQ